MAVVTIHEAETNPSKLIARTEAGEEVGIARGTQPVVKLEPVTSPRKRRIAGRLKGKATLPDSFFFDPIPEDELRLWEGLDDKSVEL